MTVFMPSWRNAQWLTGQVVSEDVVRALGELLVPVAVVKLGREGSIGIEDGRIARVRLGLSA